MRGNIRQLSLHTGGRLKVERSAWRITDSVGRGPGATGGFLAKYRRRRRRSWTNGILRCCSKEFSAQASADDVLNRSYRPNLPGCIALANPTYEKLSTSEPHMWFAARKNKRKVFLHVGPTNSGKTHAALKQLKESKGHGVFCAPLRLLAWQVSNDLQCSLLTGQEQIDAPNSLILACTVEICDIVTTYDVAVVDEIQLIGDPERGHAFTRALLGLQARELHLCGEAGVVKLVKNICDLTGDELSVVHYDRLSPLEMDKKPVVNFKNVRAGDCVIAFSRKLVFDIKEKIEQATKHQCAVVYGNLPPETRKIQASHFNDRRKQVLVSTDAVGMGLNLSINRIVFSEIRKFDGKRLRKLREREIRQIGGRAGRYNICKDSTGRVSALLPRDMKAIGSAISQKKPTPIVSAYVYPPREFLRARFHNVLIDILQNEIRNLDSDVSRYTKGDASLEAQAATKWLSLKIHNAFTQVVDEVEQNRESADDCGNRMKTNSPFSLACTSEIREKVSILESLCLGVSAIQVLSEAPLSMRSPKNCRAFKKYAAKREIGAIEMLQDAFSDPFYVTLFSPFFTRYGIQESDGTRQRDSPRLPCIDVDKLKQECEGPFSVHKMAKLEESYQVLDLALWLGARFGHDEDEISRVTSDRLVCNDLISKALEQRSKLRKAKRQKKKYRNNNEKSTSAD